MIVQIHKSKDELFPCISLNLTFLYSNTLTFSTAIKVFSFNAEMFLPLNPHIIKYILLPDTMKIYCCS